MSKQEKTTDCKIYLFFEIFVENLENRLLTIGDLEPDGDTKCISTHTSNFGSQ